MTPSGTTQYFADARVSSTGQFAYRMEDPTFPLDDPTLWTSGEISASGKRVTPTSLLNLPAAYQAVTRIAGDIARCPVELYAEEDGAYKPLREDPLYHLVAIQPNREMDFFKFWQRVMVFRLIWQNAYVYIVTDRTGRPAELLPLLPDRTKPKRKKGTLYYETRVDNEWQPLPAERVIHLEGIGFDNLQALELTKMMRTSFGLALAQYEFTSRVYRGGGRRGGLLEIPAGMSKTAGDRLEEGFRKKYEDENSWFTTVILRDNAKFHEAQMTLRDSQAIEGREESARDIARAFNIRPGHVGVETSGVYGNKSDDTRDYLDMTLRPHMTAIAAQLRIKLLPKERQASNCFGHNTDELLQMSVQEEFEAYGAGVQNTIITSNEARGKLGFPPHEDGDELRNPNTQQKQAAGNGEQVKGKKTPKGKPDPNAEDPAGEDPATEDQLDRAHDELVTKTIRDVMRVVAGKAERAAASGAKFVAWLDEKLPAEQQTLRAALAPVAACIEARGARREWQGAAAVAREIHESIFSSLQDLASSKSEAELKAAVIDYFTNLEKTACFQITPFARLATRAST